MPRKTEDYFTNHVGKQYYVHFIDDYLIADSLKFVDALRWHFGQEAEGNRDWSLTGPVNGKWRIHAWTFGSGEAKGEKMIGSCAVAERKNESLILRHGNWRMRTVNSQRPPEVQNDNIE
uniref:Uncharacterized protein n=1 Tax=Fusarium oxysporum (strain Fo5176) TaxID=660025 RepID=A0A0D2YAJ2_FUSOF